MTKTATTAGTVSFGVISANSNLTLTAKVTDSRGNSTTVTKTIVIEQYTKPTLSPYGSNKAIICGRSNSSGTIDRMGTSLKISVKGACFPLSNGKNTATLTLSGITTNPIELTTSYNQNVPNVTLAGTTVYTATIKCTDKFGEYAQVKVIIPSQYADFNLRDGGRGAAFGEMATETDVLSISENWLLKAKKGASMEGKKITNVATPTANTDGANKQYVDTLVSNLATSTASVGSTVDYVVAQGTSGIWTYRKWNSGIAECWSTGYVEENITSWSTAQTAQSNASIVISHYKLLTSLLFPFKFVNTPSVQVSGYQSASIGTNAIIFAPIADSSGVTCYTFCLGVSVSGTVRASYYAIGKWK